MQKRGSTSFKRRWSAEDRQAIVLALDLKGTGTHPDNLPDLAKQIFPQLDGKTAIAREAEYIRIKDTLKKLSGRIMGYYGCYPESEEKRWESAEDRALLRQIKVRWPEFHRLKWHIQNFLVPAEDGRHRVIQDGDMSFS